MATPTVDPGWRHPRVTTSSLTLSLFIYLASSPISADLAGPQFSRLHTLSPPGTGSHQGLAGAGSGGWRRVWLSATGDSSPPPRRAPFLAFGLCLRGPDSLFSELAIL
ncbi:unnamed protein product [Natator depressus]